MSEKSFEESYMFRRTFFIHPKEFLFCVLVFKTEMWWDEDSEYYRFRFNPGDKYEVSMGFEKWDEGKFIRQTEIHLYNMTIKPYIANLSSDRNSGFWSYDDINRTTGDTI